MSLAAVIGSALEWTASRSQQPPGGSRPIERELQHAFYCHNHPFGEGLRPFAPAEPYRRRGKSSGCPGLPQEVREDGAMRVVAISDTHAPRFWKRCPPAVARHLETAELILHAGDVCTPSVLEELSQFAPVHVVLGNNDGEEIAAWGAPVTQELHIDGVLVAMIHDSGPPPPAVEPNARTFSRCGSGDRRSLAHSAGPDRCRLSHRQPRLADGQTPSAARHRCRDRDRGWRSPGCRDRRGQLTAASPSTSLSPERGPDRLRRHPPTQGRGST